MKTTCVINCEFFIFFLIFFIYSVNQRKCGGFTFTNRKLWLWSFFRTIMYIFLEFNTSTRNMKTHKNMKILPTQLFNSFHITFGSLRKFNVFFTFHYFLFSFWNCVRSCDFKGEKLLVFLRFNYGNQGYFSNRIYKNFYNGIF